MNLSMNSILMLNMILISLDAFLIIWVIINKSWKIMTNNNSEKHENVFSGSLFDANIKGNSKYFFKNYTVTKQTIKLPQVTMAKIAIVLSKLKLDRKYRARISSIFKITRMEASVHLGVLATENARIALENAIVKEKNYPVKLYMANSLTDIGDCRSIPILVSTLLNTYRWYKNKVIALIISFEEKFHEYLPAIIDSKEMEHKELIVEFASSFISKDLKDYLIRLIDDRDIELNKLELLYEGENKNTCSCCIYGNKFFSNGDVLCRYKGVAKKGYVCRKYVIIPASIQSLNNYRKLVYKAMEVLASLYYTELDNEKYLNSNDVEIKNIAIKALSNIYTVQNFKKLVQFLNCEETHKAAIYSISKVLENNPVYIGFIVKLFSSEQDERLKLRLGEILTGRIEYFIIKLSTIEKKRAADIIKEILLLGRSSEIIGFLNMNKDLNIENELIAIIKDVLKTDSNLKRKLSTYLNERLLEKCNLMRIESQPEKKQEKIDRKITRYLFVLMFLSLSIFPIIYFLGHFNTLFVSTFIQQFQMYVIEFNYYLAYYSAIVNLTYILLLILSVVSVSKQIKLWRIKNESLLFKKNILPSVSIIAPAYNEEKTIIESANSLLNLKYPDYELIVVNDGSKDNTLNTLISYFELVRIDYIYENRLKTKPVRGIYTSKSLPKLIVVDKENGGKADSLNAGINISTKEYFCGIDADSLLEDEALLKLASLTLDEGYETPALGGNIFPINGCTVDHGVITKVKIPKSNLARFQTVEYIRAFMAGRLGWSYINSLLIISGAFGLFRKERIISVGGYLTSSERYGKDTVGEDMELVVRVSRLMRELKLKFRICYAFNANCWTEVPEDLKSLKKQRYRWHRGLIDILVFHKKVIFNWKYGRMGLLALPYFFIFEIIGPLIEIQGIFMVVIAFFFGLLNYKIIALLVATTILLGIMVSVSSLWIAEREMSFLSSRDIFLLVLYSILENFGPRQIFSLWRVGGYLNMFRKPTGWGKLERKGFLNQKEGKTDNLRS